MRMDERNVVLVDHYGVLGLPSSGERGGAKLSEEEIRKAYRRKALELHPDKRGGDSSDDFQKLQYSYQILINPVTRHSFHQQQQQQWFQQQHYQYFYTRRQQDEDFDNCFKEQQQYRYGFDDDHQEQRDHDRSESDDDQEQQDSSDDDQEEEEFRHDQHIHIHNNDHLTGMRHSYWSHHEHINKNLFGDEQVFGYNKQQQPHCHCSYPYRSPIPQQQQPHYCCSYPYSSPIPQQSHYHCSYSYHYLSAESCHGNHVHCPREECLSQHKEFEVVCRRRLQPSGPHSGFHTTVPQPPRRYVSVGSCHGNHAHRRQEECLSQHKECEAVCRKTVQPSEQHFGFHATIPQPPGRHLSTGSCHKNHVHRPREECLSQHTECESSCRRRRQPSEPHSGFHTTVPQPPRIRRCNFWGIFRCFGSSFIYLSAIFIAVLIVVL